MILEICTTSVQSSINAETAGAHRIELCTELAVGGITPSYGLLKEVIKSITIDVFVLVRPRSGNFTYSDAEFEIMKHDIQMCKDLDCAGIVSGVLNSDNTIDIKRTQELIKLSAPLPFTFHRAFDWTPNPEQALNDLINIGVTKVLTSGQSPSAIEGLELLKQLKDQAQDKLLILPGGGVNSENAIKFKQARFTEIHASASTLIKVNKQPKIGMNSAQFFSETHWAYSDEEKIKSILEKLNHEN